MKKVRVSVIKDNIKPQTRLPSNLKHDCDIGQWADRELAKKGHRVDETGLVDLPDYGVDNKTRKKGSTAPHTVGSMTIPDIIATPDWQNTRLKHKLQNINQITWDPDFLEVSSAELIDFDINEVQKRLSNAYSNLQQKVVQEYQNGERSMTLTSDCKTMIFDGYGHENSYRMRITDRAMKNLKNISAVRDTFQNLYEVV
jgi:hypothetical protein